MMLVHRRGAGRRARSPVAITDNTFWNDTSGNPVYSRRGGVFKLGDTYYWYGVHYRGAESYRANPTRKYDGEVSFENAGAWTTRSTKTLTAALNAGGNTVRLEPTAPTACPNVDYLDVAA